MVRNAQDNWYFKLSCGHLRLISLKKTPVIENETEVYCRKCDDFAVAICKESRFNR